MKPVFSIIVPVYNRPAEVDELLESLVAQSYTDFEVLIIEDGSVLRCEDICQKYTEKLHLRYFFKENGGQGFARNFGFAHANGDYFIVFDSDCIIPSDYLQIVDRSLKAHPLDAFGGPDAAHASFTPLQKAISYSMTSPFTTGGIRGGKKHMGMFHPRSFNMGISRRVWEATQGYIITRMGEDLEFSMRIHRSGFKIGLISEAIVYHKRRTSLSQFYKQLHFFGRARINIFRFYKEELELLHMLPLMFTLGLGVWALMPLISMPLFKLGAVGILLFVILIFGHSFSQYKSLHIAVLSVAAAFTQLIAYGVGFATEGLRYFKQPQPSGLNR